MSRNAEDIVTVAVVTNPLEAKMIANMLRAEGIAATAEGGNQPGITGNAEVRILVRGWDAARARKALRAERSLAEPVSRSPKRVTTIKMPRPAARLRRAQSPRGRRYGKGSS
jgi:hypothetical protein